MNINLTKKTRLLTKDKVCRENIDIIPSLQEKSVTSNGIVVPDSGFVGLNKVTVNVPEVAGNVMASIDNPRMPKLGRLKCYEGLFQRVNYKDIYASSDVQSVTGVGYDSQSAVFFTLNEAYAGFYGNFNGMPSQVTTKNNGDDIVYGYESSGLSARWGCVTGGYATAPHVFIPAFTCKVTLFEAGKYKEVEYAYNSGLTLEEITYSAYDMYVMARHLLTIGCNLNGGLIVAAEFEYPKGDVVFSVKSTGFQYRIADSGPFIDITDGLKLNQVEHVTIRNAKSTVAGIRKNNTFGFSNYSVAAGGQVVIPLPKTTTATIVTVG